jgi:type IV secretion system protein VirB1
VIAADYDRAAPQPGAEQAALRTSLSLYNTGDPARGFRNGYVAKVTAAAGQIVPALQPGSAQTAAPPPPPPPSWDVFARVGAAAGFVFSPAAVGDRP